MNANQPAVDFHNRLERTLLALGFYHSATNLLTGIIITTMALIATVPHFVLKPIAINYILSLRDEISILCAIYKVDVAFHFDSIMETPAHIFDDFVTLSISGAMLSKNPTHWKHSNRSLADTQLLLNFLELVRTLVKHYGSQSVADIIADFDRLSSLHLPPTAARRPGIGRRVANPFRSANRQANFSSSYSSKHAPASVPTPALMPTPVVQAQRTHAKSSVRFNPFASRTRVAQPPKQSRPQLDLDDENSPTLLSDAPLRMRRRLFGFGGF
ncbi:hypothetical protein FRC10_003495 [Ceratobasidium sp. 414]|nr:hypothetical protein FRC10_003495 [Ceratobasidium sp. 414]